MPPTSQLLRLSQGQLNLLETCPRKFQYIYIEQLNSLVTPEQQERQIWGSRFHLLMQQREMGLPIDLLVKEDPQLQRWVTALCQAAPEILAPQPQTERNSEHCRTLSFQGYLLTVIYDLLIVDAQQAQILDWKTYQQPKKRQTLADDWQTRLYLYVLAETSDYLPEQISMTYWFVQSEPEPQGLKFVYDRQQHEQTRQDLTELLARLSNWLESDRPEKSFPPVKLELGRCRTCHFSPRCYGTADNSSSIVGKDWLFNIAAMQEVSI